MRLFHGGRVDPGAAVPAGSPFPVVVALVLVVLAATRTACLAAAPATTGPSPVGAVKPVRRLDLRSCIDLATRQNPDLLGSLQAEQAARWRYYQQRALFNPTLTASAYRKQLSEAPLVGNSVRSFSSKVTDESVTFNQTLYTFGRLEAGKRARKLQSRASRIDTETARQAVRFEVVRAYYDVVLAKKLIQVASDNVAQVQRQFDQARMLFEGRLAARFDVIRARTQLANAQPALIRAQQDHEVQRQALLRVMGVEDDLEFDVADGFDDRAVALDREGALRMAFEHRPDLLALMTRYAAARSSVKEQARQNNPVLNVQSALDRTRGQKNPYDESVPMNYYQVAVSFPIWDGGVRNAKVGEAVAELGRLEQQVKKLRDTIRFEVVQALALIREALAVIASSSAVVDQAREAVEIVETAYRQGLRTNLEVLDAQLARDTALTNQARACRDYAVARALLERALGHELPGRPVGLGAPIHGAAEKAQ
ncbi:MAG: TolC family protein [Candidatus Riflebacteria bacterium]|nr:TolC family protein [Candidatus Riflebacteria bacterium]